LGNENCSAEIVPMQEGSEDQNCEEKGRPSDELLVHETFVEDTLSNFYTCPMQGMYLTFSITCDPVT